MPAKKETTVAQMQSGQKGKIIEVAGGYGLRRRLEAMGVRPGQQLTKVSSMFMRGPVTVQVNGARLALGFGMARKIRVELVDS